MRIGIDARLYGTKHGGIGRYIQELIKNLELEDQSNEYYILLSAEGFATYEPGQKNFHKVKASYKIYGLGEQLLLPILLYKYNLNLMHFPHFNVPWLYAKRYIVTIHDLIISHYPSSRSTTLNPLLYRLKLLVYNLVVKQAAQRAFKIIAVSEFTKSDIVRFLKINPFKIHVVYEGVDLPAQVGDCSQVLNKLNLDNNFILYVGSAYPHKNLEKLAEAFGSVKKDFPELKLVLVGRDNFFYQRLKAELKEKLTNETSVLDSIIFAGYLNDEDLACLYQSAKAYVFPSLLEGFGLPPLEAANYGLPVISSKASCLPEVLGESAVYFNPESLIEMTEKIEEVLGDETLRQKLIIAGHENLTRFSWRKMAEEILALYR